MVPESKDSKSLLLQIGVAHAITDNLLCMLSAIDLDDQPRLHATEVCEVGTDRMLPPKLRSPKLTAAQVPPQGLLRIAAVTAQRSRACAGGEGTRIVLHRASPPRERIADGCGLGIGREQKQKQKQKQNWTPHPSPLPAEVRGEGVAGDPRWERELLVIREW